MLAAQKLPRISRTPLPWDDLPSGNMQASRHPPSSRSRSLRCGVLSLRLIERFVYVKLDYTSAENDPVGSVSIFKRQWSSKTYNEDCELGFEKFDKPYRTRKLIERGMRVGGQDFTTFSMVGLSGKLTAVHCPWCLCYW